MLNIFNDYIINIKNLFIISNKELKRSIFEMNDKLNYWVNKVDLHTAIVAEIR